MREASRIASIKYHPSVSSITPARGVSDLEVESVFESLFASAAELDSGSER